MLKLLFWPVGRISRKDFWLGFVISYLVSLFFGGITYLVLDSVLPYVLFITPLYMVGIIPLLGIIALYIPTLTMVFLYILSVIPLYIFFVVTIKRYHDLGKSGWWSLFIFLPVVGMLFVLIECGFGPSRLFKNKWGEPVVGHLVKDKPKQ